MTLYAMLLYDTTCYDMILYDIISPNQCLRRSPLEREGVLLNCRAMARTSDFLQTLAWAMG